MHITKKLNQSISFYHQETETEHNNHNNNHRFTAIIYWSTCVSRHLQLRAGGFCWCKVILPACPCWWQPGHSDSGEDAGVLLNSVIYTVCHRTFHKETEYKNRNILQKPSLWAQLCRYQREQCGRIQYLGRGFVGVGANPTETSKIKVVVTNLLEEFHRSWCFCELHHNDAPWKKGEQYS